MSELQEVEKYKGKEIKYISFAKWYVVFTTKKGKCRTMNHFDTPEEARGFIDKMRR